MATIRMFLNKNNDFVCSSKTANGETEFFKGDGFNQNKSINNKQDIKQAEFLRLATAKGLTMHCQKGCADDLTVEQFATKALNEWEK